MKFILPVVFILLGLGGGTAARIFLGGDPHSEELATVDCVAPAESHEIAALKPSMNAEDLADREFVKLNNQFVVPVVELDKVVSLVVMAITIEVQIGQTELVYSREPKIRDLFLQVLFDQASLGRFSGEFANTRNLEPLREDLRAAVALVLGDAASDVLITDIARQDV